MPNALNKPVPDCKLESQAAEWEWLQDLEVPTGKGRAWRLLECEFC